jgi:hypothetical protein
MPNAPAVVRELVKLGAISDSHARRSLDRLETLEKNKPTGGQVARYATLGAVAAPAIGALGNVVRGKPPLEGAGAAGKLRDLAAQSVKGGLTSGAIPLVRSHLDRRAEIGTLRQYLNENAPEKRGMAVPELRAFGAAICAGLKVAASAPTRGGFLMASDLPPLRPPRLDRAVQKEGAPLPENVTADPADFRPVNLLKKRASQTPFQAAMMAKRIATPAARNPAAGVSIKDVSKPQGKGFGTGLPGAFAHRLGGSGPVDLKTTAIGSPST